MDAEKGKYTNGTNVQTYEDNTTLSQRWYIKRTGEKQYLIKSGLGNAVIDIATNGDVSDGANIMLFEPDGTNTQKYSIEVIDNENDYLAEDLGADFYANIINSNSEYRLTNTNENVTLNSEESSNQKANQIWRFERQPDNSYLIRCVVNGKCLDSDRASYEDGNNVQVYEDNGTGAQRWIVCELENSQYLIKSVLGEAVLDAYTTSGVVSENANAQVYHPNGTSAQVFEINKKPLLSVSVNQKPNKTIYYAGQSLDITGLQLERNYGDGVTDIVTDGFTISGYDLTVTGKQTVMVTYQNKTTTFDITVKPTIYDYQIGDSNLDGRITVSDVTAIQRYLVELENFTDEQILLADTNGDGEIDIADATHLQMYIAEFDGIVLGNQAA